MMQKMGFSMKWCNWIRFSYSITTFSVLINGSCFGFFNSSRGVRQGRPISPLLFNIAMEGFPRFIDMAANSNIFNGFLMVDNGTVV